MHEAFCKVSETLNFLSILSYFTGNQEKYSRVIKKFNAIEMLFTLYPPKGAQISNNMRLRSTWLRPIVNGEEGYKYIGKMGEGIFLL